MAAQVGPGGALFGRSDIPTIRDLYAQFRQESALERREEARRAEEQRRENIKNEALINKTWDASRVATGTPMDEAITHYLTSKRREYIQLYKDSGLSASELGGLMQQDLIPVSQYLQNAKLFNANMKKEYGNLERQGINAKDVDRLLRERMFFDKDESGNLVPKNFADVDWDVETHLNDILTNNADQIRVNQSTAVKDLLTRPLSSLTGEVYANNTPYSGWAIKDRKKGLASFDPLFHEVKTDQSGVITGVNLRTRPFTDYDGNEYINPETGKPADDVISDDAFELLYENAPRSRQLLIDREAKKRADALRKAGKEVTGLDMDYLRRSEATKLAETNVKSKFSFVDGSSKYFRRPPKAASSGKKAEDFVKLDDADRLPDGGYDITSQTGYIELRKDNYGRPVKSEQHILYEDGSLRVIYREKDRQGYPMNETKEFTYSPEEAVSFLEKHRNLPGNKRPTERLINAVKNKSGATKSESAAPGSAAPAASKWDKYKKKKKQ